MTKGIVVSSSSIKQSGEDGGRMEILLGELRHLVDLYKDISAKLEQQGSILSGHGVLLSSISSKIADPPAEQQLPAAGEPEKLRTSNEVEDPFHLKNEVEDPKRPHARSDHQNDSFHEGFQAGSRFVTDPLECIFSNVAGGELDTLKYLHGTAKADVTVAKKDGTTPLSAAAGAGHLNIVQYLCQEVAVDANSVKAEALSPVSLAAQKGHLEVVRYLCETAKANAQAPDTDGETPIFKAAINGHLEVVRYLREEAKVDALKPRADGGTPVSAAAYGGHLNIVRYLREEAKADTLKPELNGQTSLFHAAWGGHLEVVRYLCEEANADALWSRNDDLTARAVVGFNRTMEASVKQSIMSYLKERESLKERERR